VKLIITKLYFYNWKEGGVERELRSQESRNEHSMMLKEGVRGKIFLRWLNRNR